MAAQQTELPTVAPYVDMDRLKASHPCSCRRFTIVGGTALAVVAFVAVCVILRGPANGQPQPSVKFSTRAPAASNSVMADAIASDAASSGDLFGASKADKCTTYNKVTNGECADACLDDTVGVCPISIVVKFGDLEKGSCADLGYTVADGTTSQKAGPCGTLTFNLYKKTVTTPATTAAPIFTSPEGILPVWTYADETSCLETRFNYGALWVTEKGTSIDTGHPSGKIEKGQTCAEKGYTKQNHILDDLPAVVKAIYAGVTSWEHPSTTTTTTSSGSGMTTTTLK